MKIDLNEVREFFERKGMPELALKYFNRSSNGFKEIFDIFLTALEFEKKDKVDSLDQLKKINDNIDILHPLLSYGIRETLSVYGETHIQYRFIQSSI